MEKIIGYSKNKLFVVGVGTKIEIEVEGHVQSWQIVGFGESDILSGKISCEAPLIKQILGAKKGNKIRCKIIDKDVTVTIKDIFPYI